MERLQKYAYDSEGNIISIEDSSGNVIQYEYDDVGNRISQRLFRVVINYDYDANGNVISATVVVETSEGKEERKTTYVYDSMNRVIETIDCYGNSEKQNITQWV